VPGLLRIATNVLLLAGCALEAVASDSRPEGRNPLSKFHKAQVVSHR